MEKTGTGNYILYLTECNHLDVPAMHCLIQEEIPLVLWRVAASAFTCHLIWHPCAGPYAQTEGSYLRLGFGITLMVDQRPENSWNFPFFLCCPCVRLIEKEENIIWRTCGLYTVGQSLSINIRRLPGKVLHNKVLIIYYATFEVVKRYYWYLYDT